MEPDIASFPVILSAAKNLTPLRVNPAWQSHGGKMTQPENDQEEDGEEEEQAYIDASNPFQPP